MFFSPKCPYCKGKNLYLKRTSPMEVGGCKDCEKKTDNENDENVVLLFIITRSRRK